MQIRYFLTYLVLVAGHAAYSASLPPEALELIRELPEGKLTLSVVTTRSMKTSDSYRALLAQKEVADVGAQRLDGVYNARLKARLGWQDDKRQPQIVFSPNRIQGTEYALGVTKLFPTGTALDFEISHGTNSLAFTTIPTNVFAETKAKLSLRQSLWKDSFGTGSRAALEAAGRGSEASRAAYSEDRQSWFLQLSELYYQSWQGQKLLQAAEDSGKRRDRLRKIMGIRFSRGTAERPDVLQVEAAQANAQVGIAQARQVLEDRWRLLVTTLKLPAVLLTIDPRLVPLWLDEGENELFGVCEKTEVPGKSSATVERARFQREAAHSLLQRAESEKKPELNLLVNVGANSISPNSDGTVKDFLAARNPLVGAGVELIVPLGSDTAEADRRMAAADLLRAEAAVAIQEDNWRVQWRNGCHDLIRLRSARDILKKALEQQVERERLEEDRFRLGRGTTLQVIQAGDDVMNAQTTLWASEVQIKTTAWRLQAISGQLEPTLDGWEKQKKN